MAKTGEKLNRAGTSHSGYISRPLDYARVFAMHLSACERMIFSAVRGYSLNGYCEFTYGELAARYNTSISVVARAVRKIKENDKFERGEKVYQYAFIPSAGDESANYTNIDEWLYFAEFDIAGRSILLTKTQVEILSFIRGFPKSKDGSVELTRRFIASKLGVAPSTVVQAIEIFVAAKLLTVTERAGYSRPVNDHTRSKFTIDERALQKKAVATVRRAKRASKTVEGLDALTDRSRYYAQKKALEEARIAEMQKELEKDEEFRKADKEFRILDVEAVKAEHAKNYGKLRELLELRGRAQTIRRKRMELHGLSEQDFEPRYTCPECKDTGNRADGTFCDCWRLYS